MSDELSPGDRLFYTVKELNGWYQALEIATDDFYGNSPARYHVGRLFNTVLLSAGEEAEPLAIAGELDSECTGDLTIVYRHLILRVSATRIKEHGGTYDVRIWPLTAVTELRIEPRRSYFEGTDTHPRHEGVRVTFTLGGDQVALVSKRSFRGDWAALSDDSIYAAFLALRDAQ